MYGGGNGASPHSLFNTVYSGDMLVYDESNGDNWSGFFGSKPELKYQIRKIFSKFRSVENLLFATKAEYERIKTIEFGANEGTLAIKNDFNNRKTNFKQVLEQKLGELEKARYEISILLHHDAITGTNSPTPEKDYLSIAFAQQKNLN